MLGLVDMVNESSLGRRFERTHFAQSVDDAIYDCKDLWHDIEKPQNPVNRLALNTVLAITIPIYGMVMFSSYLCR